MPEQKRSLLSRIGRGAIAFGMGTTPAQNDALIANRDFAQNRAEISNLQLEQERQRPQAEAELTQLRRIALGGGEQADAALDELFARNPEMGKQMFDSIGATSTMQREDAARRAARIMALPPEMRDAEIDNQAQELTRQGRDPKDTISLKGKSPEEQDFILRATQAAARSQEQRDRAANQDRAASTAERNAATSENRLGLDRERFEFEQEQAAALAPLKIDEAQRKQVEANLKTEEGLRKEVNNLMKSFFQVSEAHSRVRAAGTEPSAAGDLALIFNYMKMLDPGSTVREGEFANAQNSGGVDDRVRSVYNSLINGTRLSDDQRGDFLGRSDSLFAAAQQEAQKTATAYEEISRNAGVNVDNVLATFNSRKQDVNQNPTVTAQSEVAEGTVIVNQQTGERLMLQNGQWVPAT